MPTRYNLIEAKHKYQYLSKSFNLSTSNGNVYDSGCVKVTKLLFPTIGAEEYQRIGNKINSVQLRVEYDLNLSSYQLQLLPSTLSTAADPNFFMKFRVMLIDIVDKVDISQQDAYDYFTNMFIYYSDGNQQSNHVKSLRVSGPNTGNFSILYDECFIIDTKHPFHHKAFNVKLANTLKFDGNQQTPENHNYYLWFIMPKYYYMDISQALQDQITALYDRTIEFKANLKLTWFDN